ncbi:MAG: hypothetical protein ACE15D_13645 [Candidatus Eisenbacteria bacterium]|nr:hypothetical protein [Candidatus Eisenbacteria bacterium]
MGRVIGPHLLRLLVLSLFLTAVAWPALAAAPVLGRPGSGIDPYHPALPREVVWQQDPNVAGYVFTSEEFPDFHSETANDFVLPQAATVRSVTWWGGFFNGPPHVELAGFWFRWFRDGGGCAPAEMIREELILGDCEESQIPGSEIYAYRADVSPVDLEGGVRYWLVIQARNWYFPPQWGRVAALAVEECESVFRCPEAGYPDWTVVSSVIGEPYDASFALSTDSDAEACCWGEGFCSMVPPEDCTLQYGGTPQGPGSSCVPNACPPPPIGACCLGEDCQVMTEGGCWMAEGDFQGPDTDCDPNPCIVIAVEEKSWGNVKAMFR